MNGKCINMDKTCNIAGDALAWLDSGKAPKVYFAGMTPVLQFLNPSAPHLEVAFMERGSVESLRIGDLMVDIPEGSVCVQGLHFGAFSPEKRERGRAWCAIVDLSGAPASLGYLKEEPLFDLREVGDGAELVAAFMSLRSLCIRQGNSPLGYDSSVAMFDPDSPRCPSALAMRVKAALLNLFGIIEESGRREGSGKGRRPDMVERLLRIIEANYVSKRISPESLSKELCLTPNHLGRLFKSHFGMGPMAYVQKLRLREAATLLRNTGHRVEMVARMVGYEDPLYFSRLFKKEFKSSPRAFREGA